MDIVERVARAICLESSGTGEAWEEYTPEARAALAAMLDAVGEPVAFARDLDGNGSLHMCAKDDSGCVALYSLAALREEL